MTQAYSNPARKNDLYALPDVEIWESFKAWTICKSCGECELPYESVYVTDKAYCPSCNKECDRRYNGNVSQFWYWFCLPGYLPDSDPIGPFESYDAALLDAQADSMDESDE